MIDSFAKSRGNDSVQAYYWNYISRNTGFAVIPTIDTLIDEGGLPCLADNEREMFDSAYEHVKKHTPVQKWESQNEVPFNNGFRETLDYANLILKNEGKTINYKGRKITYGKMDPKVLKLNPEKFLEWLTTEGQNVSLHTP